MPTSKIYLPDVNVWLALASERHVHAPICGSWLNSIRSGEVVFCRVTQMGLLRLLTHESVMGKDVLSSREAWRVYRTILADERIQFVPEPFALELEWRRLTAQERPTPKIWTDAYLAAFARAGGMQLVTLDRAVLLMAREARLLK
jgi:Predicted nucleic acid-binding protein, contains PIN domain